MSESRHNVFIKNKLEIIEDAASNFYDPQILTLLDDYEREFGNDVIVTIFDLKYLKYFDAKVTSNL